MHARVIPLLALPLSAWACGSSAQISPAIPDARGCSDWPSRAGKTLVSLDGESQFEVEPFLLAAPDDLAIAWEAYGCDDVTRPGYTRRRAAASFDEIRYLASPHGQMASNITLGRDRAGSLYMAWASWTPGPDQAQPHLGASDLRIQFARWPASADDFESPVELSEPITASLYDKPWLVVTAGDAIIVSYSDLRRQGIWTAASADGGATFQRTLVDPDWANLAAMCPDGRPGGAFITYFANGTIRVAHTTDGGATWTSPAALAVSDATGAVAIQDPTCIASGDEVWVAYGRTHDSYDVPVARLLRVQVAHTILGNAIIDRDVVALEAAPPIPDGGGPPAPGFLLFPQLTGRSDGALAVAAYHAASEGTGTAVLVYAVSTDGGQTFGSEQPVTTGLTPSLQRHVPDWLGDYFGWAAAGAGLGAAFVDNASGFSHIAFAESL
jgi:hypothetical protein